MAERSSAVKQIWSVQHRRFALWAPAMIGIGVWARMRLEQDVPWPVMLLIAVGTLILMVAVRRRGLLVATLLSSAMALSSLGYLAAERRIASIAAPVLEGGFRGQVTGRVIEVGRSRSRAPRVLIDQISLAGVRPFAVPERARITLVDQETPPAVGSVVSVRAVLGPPAGPAAPGGFDFSEQAFFQRIGAIGYARGDVDVIASDTGGGVLWLAKTRASISAALRSRIDGEAGAVAAALIVGDRSAIAPETTQDLRDSGLAHLLAISGLHIGLMSALMFWLVRAALALMPRFASRFPIKKIAACAGLGAAAAYLALAGFGVATQRAFIMAAVAFGAILLDRPAVTMRALAAAACLVLLLRPESLFGAGFQMSFAAVAALVAGYEVTRGFWRRRAQDATVFKRFMTGVIATIATSVMAGAATAPFAAYHFNRLVAYGLPANLLATPAMGLWIMPAIILSAALAPFGLAGIGLAVLGWGISYVLWVADGVASFDGAAFSVGAASPLALALMVFGGLWLVIWHGGLRIAALIPLVAGLMFWRAAERPDVFISENARLIAGRTEAGVLWVSRERVSGYSADTWLRRDGAGETTQAEAYRTRRWSCDRSTCSGTTSDGRAIILVRIRSRSRAERACRDDAVVIAPKVFARQSDCTMIDRSVLDRASAVAVSFSEKAGAQVRVARPTRHPR